MSVFLTPGAIFDLLCIFWTIYVVKWVVVDVPKIKELIKEHKIIHMDRCKIGGVSIGVPRIKLPVFQGGKLDWSEAKFCIRILEVCVYQDLKASVFIIDASFIRWISHESFEIFSTDQGRWIHFEP